MADIGRAGHAVARRDRRRAVNGVILIDGDGSIGVDVPLMAAGEVAIMESANMLRLKNLYVAPEARGGSLGAEAVAFVQREALRRGKRGMGVFGVEGSPGARTYQKCGLRVEGERVEWSRQL